MVYVYNGILAIRKWNCAICRDVNGPRDCHIDSHIEVIHKERNKYCVISLICGI